MKFIRIFIFLILFISCTEKLSSETEKASRVKSPGRVTRYIPKPINLDSLEKINTQKIERAGSHINKALIFNKDSSLWIGTSKWVEHRIFGYDKPNSNSKRLILISCFTGDVEGNPYNLKYGAFYTTDNDSTFKFKFRKFVGKFAKVEILKDMRSLDTVYFGKKWLEFE